MYKESPFDDLKTVAYKKGKVLIRPDEKVTQIFYLLRGSVKMYAETPNGTVTIHIFKRGSFFPIMLAVGKISNKYYFKAITSIKVKQVEPESVIKILKSDPELLFDLTKRLSFGLDGLATRIIENFGERVDKKLFSTLSYLADSFGKKVDGKVKIKIPLTHNDLASWLGVSRETVSREMKKMSKNGLISYRYKQVTLLKK